MARRTKEDAAITREQLLDAAERVFRERGVAGSTLAEVAAAAGVTRGAVYWHFRDKADVYAAMCERATLPLETMLDAAGASVHADPLAALRKLASAALSRLAGDPRSQAVFEVMFHKSEGAAELAPVTERKQRERRHCLAQVERVLQQAVRKGQLAKDTDTALATQALHAYIAGIMHEWMLDPTAFDLAAAAPALIDVVLAGLRVSPPRRMTASTRRECRVVPGLREKSTIGRA
ncbi:MAG: TetR family transcriptional regulator [Casimicrobiaceae bacterium]